MRTVSFIDLFKKLDDLDRPNIKLIDIACSKHYSDKWTVLDKSLPIILSLTSVIVVAALRSALTITCYLTCTFSLIKLIKKNFF